MKKQFGLIVLCLLITGIATSTVKADSNLITNPSFEDVSSPVYRGSYWANGWIMGTIVAHDAYTGSHSLFISGEQFYDGYLALENVQAGLYHFSMMCKPVAIPPSVIPDTFRLYLLFSDHLQVLNANFSAFVMFTDFSVLYVDPNGLVTNANVTEITNAWRRVAFDVSLPDGVLFMIFRDSSNCYYDDVWLSTSYPSSTAIPSLPFVGMYWPLIFIVSAITVAVYYKKRTVKK